ncbi:hypothetical protein BpHYR1_025667, partial [Brachionus plicatilis]
MSWYRFLNKNSSKLETDAASRDPRQSRGLGNRGLGQRFKCEAGKQAALRGARRLKDSSLRNVYINPNKTPSERILDANLRNERDKRNNELDQS